ncbi:MAG: twin-arginine translocase TatA/TatE family subunit [Microbacteriaceae bacterium]|nr:twin-arginine translocase TatA/TatE family subunit [Microbacteriaceae bacterium]MCL2794866.1 twin-arginine translocase TatA/TatE family subunit [Microbacteriaceae bacterium]
MLKDLFSGWHLIIVLLIVVLLFGATRLPVFAKSLGQSMNIFRKEMKTLKDDVKSDDEAASADKTASTSADDKK